MLNFNVDPYYDDFDPNKNFHRVLFRPGRAVQARELTQSQTILQNQITSFADHFFNQNTPIKGGNVTINNKVKYVKLNSSFQDNDITASDFLNQIVTDDTGLVLAKVVATEEAVGTDPPTLVLSYFSGVEFANGSNVISQTTSAAAQAVPSDATGFSSVASIANGIFYVVNGYNYSSVQNPDGSFSQYSIGNFVGVQPQTIVINKYNNQPNARIGLEVSEYISDYVTDASLLDPAVGATNYQAPGADRYTIDLNLTTKEISPTVKNDQNFIELTRVENGVIVRQVNGTSYSAIDNYFAQRTYETNGDFIVSDFKLSAVANTLPGGSSKYVMAVGPGVAYVKGYRTENQSLYRLNGNRARTTSSVNNEIISAGYGNYLFVNSLQGNTSSFIDVTRPTKVDLHVVTPENVNTTSVLSYTSTLAGNAYIRNIQFDSTSNGAANTYIYKLNLYDVTTGSLTGNATTSSSATVLNIFDSATAPKFSNKSNAYDGASLIVTSGPGIGDIRPIVGYNGLSSPKKIYIDTAFSSTPTPATNFSIIFSISNADSLMNVNSSRAIQGSAIVDNKSKQSYIADGGTYLTSTDNPELIFRLGNPYVSTMSDSSYTSLREFRGILFSGAGTTGIVDIPSGEQSTFSFPTISNADDKRENLIVLVTDKGLNSNVANGEILEITSTPSTVTATTSQITISVPNLLPFTATVFSKLEVNNADNSSYVRRIKTLVQADTTSLGISGATATVDGVKIDLTKGQIYIPNPPATGYSQPQSLFVSDVKRIVKIINVGSSTPVLADLNNVSKDVTNNFLFNNGQRDSIYDHASIRQRPGAPAVGGLWILFDYYAHSGGDGYFNVNSYVNENYVEIPVYRSSKGTTYSLRDCIDFRPVRKNATLSSEFNYTVAPTSLNSKGLLLPLDTTNVTFDYSYYLGRKDLLVMTKDSELVLVEGKPSLTPQFPPDPTNGLVIAKLTHDPYTEYVPEESSGRKPSLSIVPVQHKNWQMKDITEINDRVNNIQYYSALNLLEQSAAQLQIRDNFDLNRFKNGILVDNFSTFSVADTYSLDFSASINTRKGYLAPAQDVKNFQLQNIALLDSISRGNLSEAVQSALGYKVHKAGKTNVITLQYTEVPMIVQSLASRTYDVNSSSARVTEGVLDLTPPMDNWIDTEKEPALLFVDPTLSTYRAVNQLNLLQEGDWQAIPGTRVSSGEIRDLRQVVQRVAPPPVIDYSDAGTSY
jgi:hypothetical protein